jgi:hypothetical protein
MTPTSLHILKNNNMETHRQVAAFFKRYPKDGKDSREMKDATALANQKYTLIGISSRQTGSGAITELGLTGGTDMARQRTFGKAQLS